MSLRHARAAARAAAGEHTSPPRCVLAPLGWPPVRRVHANSWLWHEIRSRMMPMVLLVLVVVGVAIFCIWQGYIAAGIICLAGLSKTYGWPALIATSAYLFVKGHWIAGALPVGLILWNVLGLLLRDRDADSVAKTCKSIYHKSKKMRPGKSERDYLKIVLLTKPPFDFQRDKVIDLILDKCLDIDSLAQFVSEDGRPGADWWARREQNIVVSEERLEKRNAEFFDAFWNC